VLGTQLSCKLQPGSPVQCNATQVSVKSLYGMQIALESVNQPRHLVTHASQATTKLPGLTLAMQKHANTV
jgi:hypothetical protein